MLMRWAWSPVILFSANLAISAPFDYFPINSQLPPVARISEPFSFAFSPLTFSSPFPISYSLVDTPSWLSIDNNSRTLSGTPTEAEITPGTVVGVPIGLIASDDEGSTIANVTLVVSRNSLPEVKIPFSDQISDFGIYSVPSSILLQASRNFSFSFDPDTFSQSGLIYYAVSGDNTPLPSWISFDAINISFSGRTPSFEAPLQLPQTFDIQLVASDVAGFSSVAVPFSFVIGNHELTADTPFVVLSATPGTPFQYSDLRSSLKLDNQALDITNVSSIIASGTPDWLDFDTKTWEFRGTPGLTANSNNITITIEDVYADKLNVSLVIEIGTEIFISDLPPLNVSAGGGLVFDLKPYLRDPADVDIRVLNQSQTSWVRFDSSKSELFGTVPIAATTSQVEVLLEAQSKASQRTELRNLTIQIAAGTPTTSESSSLHSSTPSTISNPTPTSSSIPESSVPEYSTIRIVLAVLIPLVLLCLVALILLLCCWRKRRQPQKDEHVPEVSAPIPGTFVKHDASSLEGGALHGMFNIENVSTRTMSGSGELPPAPIYRIRTSSNTGLRGSNTAPHAMTLYAFDYRRSLSDSTFRGTRESWLAGQYSKRRQSPRRETLDDANILSDASTETGYHHRNGVTSSLVISGTGAESFRRSLAMSPVPGLGSPVFNEPFSIQTTPEVAYIAGGYDTDDVIDSEPSNHPELAYSGAPELSFRKPVTLRTTSARVSKAWMRSSPSCLLEEYKRKSNTSISTLQTNRTSILTEAGGEDPATANIISRPTVIHVPSRTGKTWQISRRVDGSTALPRGGSTSAPKSSEDVDIGRATSLRPSTEDLPVPPSVPYDTTVARDSDSSWSRIGRNSLGIVYKDIVKSSRSVKSMITVRRPLSSLRRSSSKMTKEHDNVSKWNDPGSKDLISPDQWPRPKPADGQSRPTFSPFEPLSQVAAPITPSKDKGKTITATGRPRSKGSDDSPSRRRPPVSMKRRRQVSQEERLRIGRLKEQQAHDNFRAMVSRFEHESPRSLPEMSVKQVRPHLAYRPHSLNNGALEQKSRVSHRADKGGKTMRSNNAEIYDRWEDVEPESTPGAELLGSSPGSLSAFV